MDPALREYLDLMELNTNARSDSIVATQQRLSQQIAAQTAQLRDLADWWPDLEARFAQLQGVIADLQRHQYEAKAAVGGPATPTLADPAATGSGDEFHGKSGHDVVMHPGSLPVGNEFPPPGLPVTGMTSLQLPLVNPSSDPNLVNSQLMVAMGTTAPAMHFPQFTGENPNLWKTSAEQYFHMFSTHESYWVPMSTLHFKGAAGIGMQAVHKRLHGLD
jgi:hypothetical protein